MISIKQNLALDNLHFLPFSAIAKLPKMIFVLCAACLNERHEW
jgi:hypothetical protein